VPHPALTWSIRRCHGLNPAAPVCRTPWGLGQRDLPIVGLLDLSIEDHLAQQALPDM
jgi:hypothetical protein